jgi:hypothetical protein|tara:strand:+ start:139 stop:564 length:426 start_codon:yes stop_codon:yes gene_type:complete
MLLDAILYLNSILLGAMLFFVIIVSPTVFTALSSDQASKFLRLIFPRLFLFGLVLSLLSALGYIVSALYIEMFLALFASILFFLNRNILTPLINYHRDKEIEGDIKSKNYFKLLHLLSVSFFVINLFILVFFLLNNTFNFV